MNDLLNTGGRWVGASGLLLCALAATWRLLGNYYLGGFEIATLFEGGTSAVLIGCFLLLLGRADHHQ
jgi:hypothetical protein